MQAGSNWGDGLNDAGHSTKKFSSFVAYVDESGDHGLQPLDSNYPIFVLAFCVFYKKHYCDRVVPALHQFKFDHFGHDLAVLHEHEIRKERGQFKFTDRLSKRRFLDELTGFIDASNFVLISCVIDKAKLRGHAQSGDNPYHLALGFCREALYEFLQEKNQASPITHVVVECRGKKEDTELELEFRRVCNGANRFHVQLPFDVVFADKKVNCPGLQLADLVARPVGVSVLRPQQENRAFEVLKRKFFSGAGRAGAGTEFKNWGLKIFPSPESERPR